MSKLTKILAASLMMVTLTSGAAYADRDHGHGRHGGHGGHGKHGWNHGHYQQARYIPPRVVYRPVVYRPVVYQPAPVYYSSYYPEPVYQRSGFSFWFFD